MRSFQFLFSFLVFLMACYQENVEENLKNQSNETTQTQQSLVGEGIIGNFLCDGKKSWSI